VQPNWVAAVTSTGGASSLEKSIAKNFKLRQERHLPHMPPLTGLHPFASAVLQICRASGAPHSSQSDTGN